VVVVVVQPLEPLEMLAQTLAAVVILVDQILKAGLEHPLAVLVVVMAVAV
jgi:hypothetical protein